MDSPPQAAPDTEAERAQRILNGAKARWAARESNYDPIWEPILDVAMPRKAGLLTPGSSPDTSKEQALYDGTLARANVISGAGSMSWMSPADSPWFAATPSRHQRYSDPVKSWLAETTDIMREHLAAAGSCYHALHESYLNAGAIGTYALTPESDGLGSVMWRSHEPGTYSIAENSQMQVDVVDHKYELTPRQILHRYSKSTDTIPEIVHTREAGGGDGAEDTMTVWHLIFPRQQAPGGRRPTSGGPSNHLPYASVHILEEGNHIIRESGYEEFPTAVGQYLRRTNDPYGYSPGWLVYPEARQLNTLQKYADTLAELAAYPRILAPSGMPASSFDLRAYGVSHFDASKPTDQHPRPWLTEGRPDGIFERIQEKQQQIKDGYQVDLFLMFSGLQKEITAFEANQLANERLIQFSPTFALRTTQLFRPVLNRTFWILLRNGAFPQPPDEAYIPMDGGQYLLPDPHIEFSSRMALSMKALKNNALQQVLGILDPLAQANPAVLDNFDFDRIARDASLNTGLPAPWLRPEANREQLREERAAAVAAQAQAGAPQLAAPTA
jgi:hypothetical protein